MPLIDDEYLAHLRDHLNTQETMTSSPGGEDTSRKAFDKISRLISVRDRSEKELRQRLVQDSFTEESIEDAIERSRRCGMIDDLRFADTLIRSRMRSDKGKQGIEAELRRHDIEPSLVIGWPEDYYPCGEEELERALAFLALRPPRSKNRREGAYRKLMSKGYDSDLAVRAARLWSESLE